MSPTPTDDPFAKYGGKAVQTAPSGDPFAKYGGSEVKKNPSPTEPSTGSVDFTHGYKPSPADTKAKESNDNLEKSFDIPPINQAAQTYWSHLSPEEKQQISTLTAQSSAQHANEKIIATSPEDIARHKMMQSPIGKALTVMPYLATKATKGGLQLMKGLAHYASLTANIQHGQFDDKDPNIDKAFDTADKLVDKVVSPSQVSEIEGGSGMVNKSLSAAGVAANFAPAMAGGEALDIPTTMLFLQGVGQGKEAADKIPNLKPLAREALIEGSGAVNLVLSKIGGKMFGDLAPEAKSELAQGITAKVMNDAEGKSLTSEAYNELLQTESKTALEKLQSGGVKALEDYADNIKTFAKLKGANFAMHKAVDLANQAQGGQSVFNETPGNLTEELMKTPAEALPFTAIPALKAFTSEFVEPVEQQKHDISEKIDQNSTTLESLKPAEGDSAGQKIEKEAKSEEIEKENKDLTNQYKNLIQQQHEKGNNEESSQENGEKGRSQENGQQGDEKVNAQENDVKAGGEEPPVTKPPKPKKPLEQMNSDELFEHAKEIKQHFKDQEKSFFGEEGNKDYQKALSIRNNMFASKESQKWADETIERLESSLTPSQLKAFDTPAEIPYEDLRDMAQHVNHIENAESEDEIAGLIKNPLLDFSKDKNDKYNTAILTAAGRRATELGIDPAKMLRTAIDKIVSDLPGKKGEDLDGDKELITRSILNKIAKGAETVGESKRLEAQAEPAKPDPQKGETENATKEKPIEESSGAEHQKGNESGETAKIGSGDSPVSSKESKEGKIIPNKEIKANVKLASNEVSEKYGLKASDGEILYSQFKDMKPFDPYENEDEKDTIPGRTVNSINIEDVPPMLKGAYKNLVNKGYLHEYDDNHYLSEDGKKYIDAVKARLETRKGVKSGTDLFPRDAGLKPDEVAKLAKLPLAEHSELNTILKTEDGIDISHLKDANEQERNISGDQAKEAAADAKAVQQPENDGAGNAGKDRPGQSPERSERPAKKAGFKKPAEQSKVGEALRNLADKVEKGQINKLGGFRASTGFDAVWDTSLKVVAETLRGGAKIADAIESGLKHIRESDWYKNLSDKKDFEQKYTDHMNKELGGEGKTGIRHADTEKEREDLNVNAPIDKKDRRREVIDAKGKDLVNSDEFYAEKTAKDIISKQRPATDVEQAALEYRKTQLKNQRRKILKDTDPENAADNEIKLARIQDEIALNIKATDIGGSELGSGLGYRTQLMNEDYSTETVIGRAQTANGGEALSPKDEQALTKSTQKIQELEDKLADREEELRKAHEKNTVSKVKRSADLEERNAKREVTKASLRKEREGLVAELHLIAKKSMGAAGVNKLPVDMLVPLTKLARNYVLDGAITIAQVADKIYNDLAGQFEKGDIEDAIKDGFDKYLAEQNELRLGRAKKLQAKKLEKLQTGNYEQTVYRKILVDNEYLGLRAEINREQAKINKKINDIENSKKSLNRKIVDIAVKYGRQAKLASVTVLGKLSATGLATIGIKPVTEGLGKGWSAILPKIAKTSTVEGSISRAELKSASELTGSVGSISQAYSRAFTLGMKDAYQELKQGGSDLSALYRDKKARLPSEALEFFGHLHSAIKAPFKRFAFELSYAKRAAKAIRNGLDPLDPVIDAQNRLNAYKDGDRAIFMGDNKLSSIYENAVGSLEGSKSSTERTIGAAFRILLPFVKVPTNIVLEGAKYSFGSVSGIARLGRALSKGLDNLEPAEADIILEHLKKGSIGGAALALGFFNPKMFGGFYQQNKHEPVAPGHIKIGGVNLPAWLVEHPIFIAAQVGANFRQLLDKYRHKDDRIPTATMATIAGLGYEVPQAEQIRHLVDLTEHISSTDALTKFGAETLKGEIEPAAIQQLAKLIDPKQREPNIKKGKMRYVGQKLESGIPFASKNVDEKGKGKQTLLQK